MMGPATSGVNPWLLIEASSEGVLRFATVMPSSRPRVSAIHEIPIAGVPTFTDALQQFEREEGVPLRGLQCAMAIAGAASGETISLVRSRWTISRAGLMAIFGTQPVILNDVAARAWATRSGTANIEPLRGLGMPSFSRLIIGAPAWRVDQHEAVLTGAAERLAQDMSPSLSVAA